MKKTLLSLCIAIALLFISCSDDDVAPAVPKKEPLVTRISTDDKTILELFYDIDRKLYRLNFYLSGNLAGYNVYEYNENGLKELIQYNNYDHQMDVRTVFTLDNQGRITKTEEYHPPDFFDDPSIITQFEYNDIGQLTSRESANKRDEYVYDDNGYLITTQVIAYPDMENEFVYSKIDYTPGAQPIPQTWKEYILILELSDHADNIRNMFSTNVHYKYWNINNALQAEFRAESSDQVFDDDGNLTQQVITIKNLLEPEDPDLVDDMIYDYQNDN